MKKVVFTFGRMNPPTVGHQKLVDKVKAEAKKQSADSRVYLSHTQNKKKDPLDYNSKVKYATKAFGSIVTKTDAKTIIQVLKELQSAGYTDVTLIVGSDRIPEFKKLLTKYNGKDYQFNSINFTSAGQRDPDAEGVAGMSASKMRALAMEGDLASFKSGLPKALQASAKEIYNKLRNIMEEEDKQLDEARMGPFMKKMNIQKGDTVEVNLTASGPIGKSGRYKLKVKEVGKQFITLELPNKRTAKFRIKDGSAVGIDAQIVGKINESTELDEASLTLQQRQKRSRLMKRLAKKIQRKAQIQKRRMADSKRLQKRALKKAREIVRKKVAGEKGSRYASLSSAEKISIDKLVDKKQPLIAKIAKKLLPKVRRAEMERLKKARGGSVNEETETLTLNEIDNRKEPNLYRAMIAIDREKARDLKKFDRMRDQARIRDVIYRNRKVTKGANEEVAQDADIKDLEGTQPAKYHSGLKKSTKATRDAQFKKGAEMDHKDPKAYPDKHAGDDTAKTRTSKHTKKYHDMFGEKKNCKEEIELTEDSKAALMKKADKSGIPYSILKKVYDRGMAAWRTGHRPGAGQEQWAYARVNSFITKGKGTWGGADKDLAAKVKKESFEIDGIQLELGEALVNYNHKKQSWQVRNDNTYGLSHEKDKVILHKPTHHINKQAYSDGKRVYAHMKGKELNKEPDLSKHKKHPIKFVPDDRNHPFVHKHTGKPIKNAEYAVFNKTDAHVYTKEEVEFDEACWDGYKQVGMKKKGDKMVPDCVPEAKNPAQQAAIAIAKKEKIEEDINTVIDLNRALNKLEKRQKEIILMRFKYNMSMAKIGKELGISANSALQAYERAMKKLKAPYKSIQRAMEIHKESVELEEGPIVMTRNNALKTLVRIADDQVGKMNDKQLKSFAQMLGKTINKQATGKYVVEEVKELGPEGKAKENKHKSTKKTMKDILPKSGAGQQGTDELVKTYKDATPGMSIQEDYSPVYTAKDLGMKAEGAFAYHPSVEEFVEEYEDWGEIEEAAEYQGKKVKLNNPFRLPSGSKKKFGVYVKNDKGNVVKVQFGDPNMEIKRDDPKRRAAFRSRHSCDDNIGPKWKARYWSCYQWRAGAKVDN